ncbi:uncharacterized protein [Heptranchias perlo]|uniref:uncharacterized protein isoform X1 n=1 Tax=Heptranchias perlo TaxID=212740 RepID=UPI0035597F00
MAMDRCAKTVIFHLVSIFLMGLEAETSTIVQYPSSVTLFEGESVILNCTFRISGVGTYKWRKDSSHLDFDSPRYKKGLKKADKDAFNDRRDASIQIMNMTQCESGVYYCEIEIMGEPKAVGRGTSVTVKHSCDKPNSLKSSQFDWMWVAVAGGVTILITLTLLVVIAVLVRRNKAYALLVRECTSFDSAKEPELPHRNKVQSHANHQHEESYLHCHGNEVKTKQKRGPQTRKNMQ